MNRPVEIKKNITPASGITILWSDQERQIISAETLRKNCPCAECRQNRGEINHSEPLSMKKPSKLNIVKHSKEESLGIKDISTVGNYAIQFTWLDGHGAGIYSYNQLRQLK